MKQLLLILSLCTISCSCKKSKSEPCKAQTVYITPNPGDRIYFNLYIVQSCGIGFGSIPADTAKPVKFFNTKEECAKDSNAVYTYKIKLLNKDITGTDVTGVDRVIDLPAKAGYVHYYVRYTAKRTCVPTEVNTATSVIHFPVPNAYNSFTLTY